MSEAQIMTWALFLYGLAILLGLVAAALSALPPRPARHRVPETPERWAPSLGPGWVLHMDGQAEYVPHGRHRRGPPW